MKLHLLYILPFCMLISCCGQEKKPIINKAVEPEPDYGTLSIEIWNDDVKESMGIFMDTDTCSYYKMIKDTAYLKSHGSYQSEEHRLVLTKKEKVEVYNCFQDIVNHPVAPESTVSCYAGDYVTFTINWHGNPELSCTYSSVSDWQEISPAIKKLYKLTFERIYKQDE